MSELLCRSALGTPTLKRCRTSSEKAVTARQFIDLDRYQVLTKLLQGGTHPEPFRGNTLATVHADRGDSQNLIIRSRLRFGSPRNAIESKLDRWMMLQRLRADG